MEPRPGTVTATATATATAATTATASVSHQAITNGFYKFLARFSGRRRHMAAEIRQISSSSCSYVLLLILLATLCSVTDACSSRTTPKPRPPTPTPRPNITFHTYKCPPAYAAWYCLNEATCFTVKIGDSLLYNCECADGYMGPRCEYKDLDGSYLPTRPRVMLETASIASGATAALFLVIVLCMLVYVRWHQGQKQERLEEEEKLQQRAQHVATLEAVNGNTNSGCDTVDGVIGGGNGSSLSTTNASATVASGGVGVGYMLRSPERVRPFGPHHHHTIPMSELLLNR